MRETCPELPGAGGRTHWSIADPAADGDTDEATLPTFRRVADEIEERIALLIAELGAPPTERTHHAR